jgi:hypothetical protein
MEHRLCFNTKEFFGYCYEEKHRKVTLIFHGWEFLIFFSAVAGLTDFTLLVTGALIALQ